MADALLVFNSLIRAYLDFDVLLLKAVGISCLILFPEAPALGLCCEFPSELPSAILLSSIEAYFLLPPLPPPVLKLS